MNKFQTIVVGLLVAITTFSGITAAEVIRMARTGLEVELTAEEAEDVAKVVNDTIAARKVAEEDMR